MKNAWLAQLAFSIALLSGCHTTGHNDFLWAPPGDISVTDSVRTSIARNPELTGMPLEVTADNGVVTLRGYVQKIRQADIAAAIAQNTPGVSRVENHIVVRPRLAR